jgi:hypothetical protein
LSLKTSCDSPNSIRKYTNKNTVSTPPRKHSKIVRFVEEEDLQRLLQKQKDKEDAEMSYVSTQSSVPSPPLSGSYSTSPPLSGFYTDPKNAVVLEGLLLIQEGKLGGWKSRWFQLKTGKLIWAKGGSTGSTLGSLDLSSIQNIKDSRKRASRDMNKWKFDIITNTKVYRLAASSEAELQYWTERIQSLLQQQNTKTESNPVTLGFVLHEATRRANLAEISKLLITGYPVNQEDRSRQTPLHIAASEGHADVVKFLVEKYDAYIGARDKDDWTPLHSACFNGHLEACRYLISKGARNTPNSTGTTPLHYLVRFEIPNKTVVCEEILVSLLQQGADINAQTTTGETLLHSASLRGASAWVSILLKYKADVLAREK